MEGDSTFSALLVHDLHESDARGIVDADMDELPTDTVVTVDHARLSSGDAMSHGADPAELLDIEMDELARVLPLIAPGSVRPAPRHSVHSTPTDAEHG